MISIVIVGYNSQPHLKTCFDALYQSTTKDFSIIFVDNNSSDTSLAFIKKEYPNVIIIANNENHGFAKANNIGIARAIELKSEAVFLLNPDTAVDPHCLELLVKSSDEQSILQPIILLDPIARTTKVNTTGGVLSILGFSYCSDYKAAATDFTEEMQRPVASGAAMFIPTPIIKRLGGFDEQFFMYHEDIDLSWRARLLGYDIRLIPAAKVWHKYSFGRNDQKLYQVERNRILFLLKNFSLRYWLLLLPLFLLTELATCCYLALTGQAGIKFKSYRSLIELWPKIQATRSIIQKSRQKSDRELAPLLADRVQFSEMVIPLLKPYNGLVGLYWQMMRALF